MFPVDSRGPRLALPAMKQAETWIQTLLRLLKKKRKNDFIELRW